MNPPINEKTAGSHPEALLSKQVHDTPHNAYSQTKNVTDFDGVFEPLVPFDQFTTPDLPTRLLPPALGDYVENLTEVLSVPTAMPFMAALGMVSTAVAKKFVICPKPDWREPINIYTMTAMLPGSTKTQTLSRLKSPIDFWEDREITRIRPLRNAALTEIKLLEMELAKNEKILKGKNKKPDEIKAATDRVEGLENIIQEKKENVPVLPQVYTTDATPEAIAEILEEQDGRLAIISDEGGILEVLSGLYNSGNANVDIFLKGIDGGATRIKRANRDYKLAPYLTVTLLIQPQVLINMASKRAFTGNGALERFIYAIPIANVGHRKFSDATIDDHIRRTYDNVIFNLLSVTLPETPYVLELDVPARDMLSQFRNDIERQLRPDGILYACRGWGGKLAGYSLRLAGLMHVVEHLDLKNKIISQQTMQNAIELAKLLARHTVVAYTLMGIDQPTNDARELFEWIQAKKISPLTKSEIINGIRSRHMAKKERLGRALEILVERHVLSDPHKDTSTRKPTEVYFVNPEIYT